ncbi:BQ2448_7673 [Microbotryum intermedium]|uniref:BQ2448_7673 protein n=1 Tax=Microbotryum intermedium TaxID=269621 RepID=A0A238FS13_9BASI|nr:BQ2448_7673 [Microbotryum intermedium]
MTTPATPTPTPFGPLPIELEHLHSSLGYAFDPHLYLQLRLALACGSSHLLLRLSSTHLDKHERAQAVDALAAQLDWMCRTIFGLETNQVQCTRRPTSANAFLKAWLVLDPTPPPLSSPSSPISARAKTTRFNQRIASASSMGRGPSPDAKSAPAQPRRSLSLPRSPLVGLDIMDLEQGRGKASSAFVNAPSDPSKPSIMVGSSFDSKPSRVNSHDPDQHASLDLTPRQTQSPDQSAPSSPATASAVHWGARVAPPKTMTSSSFGQPFKLETSNLAGPPMTRRRRSTITVRPSASPSLSSKRLPQVVILERLDRTSPRTQQGMLKTLRDRRMRLDGPLITSSGLKREGSGTPTPTTTSNGFLRSRGTSEGTHALDGGPDWILPDGFLCIAIVLEEGDRGDWGGLDRYLVSGTRTRPRERRAETVAETHQHSSRQLDRFALSLTIPSGSYDFRRPPTTLSHPLSTPFISPHPFPPSILPSTFSDALVNYQNDLISTLRHHPRLEGRFLTSRASKDLTAILKTWVVITHGHHSTQDGPDNNSSPPMVLPNDVVHVLLPVLGHRLRMKDAKDEKSVSWGSEIRALKRRKGAKEGRVERVIRAVVEEV